MGCLRIEQEKLEDRILNEYAMKSKDTRGRKVEESPCDIRTEYQRDRDRIMHSKAFRRLKHKTQVFISPEGDHYRTRLTHTLEVAQISRTVARALRLNEDLTEAIALGHDLGHTPFGHSGEYALNKVCTYGFKHNEQSIRVVEKLEQKGKGLNLTWEVKDGILNHPTAGKPSTLEGKIVRLSDKIAYINHDIDDAIRAKILSEKDLPKEYTDVLGISFRARINNMIHDIVRNSMNKNDIIMSEDMEIAMNKLRKFMFANVYVGSKAKEHEIKAKNMLKQLYEYFIVNSDLLPMEYKNMIIDDEPLERVVCDYVAGMTDRYSINIFSKLFIPSSWKEL
ncbi:deoxyguanosinetriphosphate triphosphohydrolase-like protein [Vallitalea longa]|uniref:Deoxyguanosinetriphosphate triphosphohydrolase-like protein n=1 Tax=Vallitalea longa TaxID=2936439 RepID=A0A9W5YE78_9FIRM|nr:deoxyguanosinetriphosphate triphosphohydrolase [Vallitalea longa]GKX31041.1 deoxyguanosinetriphosphate triphosphohydrolase-like protein [Vallitalea longa]